MVLADSFYREDATGKQVWYAPTDVISEKDDKGRIIRSVLAADGLEVKHGGMTKMSKSKNNGIDPQQVIDVYGADTIRVFTMFAAPPEQTLEWIDSGVDGAHRFVKRLWNLTQDHLDAGPTEKLNVSSLNAEQKNLRRLVHKTIEKVTDDVGRRQTFNTAVAAVMELLNHLIKAPQVEAQDRAVVREGIEAIVLMLAPIAPHICHVLYQDLGFSQEIETAPWPQVDKAALVEDEKLVVVQVNGKVRAKITVAADATQQQVEAIAVLEHNVKPYLDGQAVRKVIYVPGKLLNIVAN
jgi:leucyl-tRNA synthetase